MQLYRAYGASYRQIPPPHSSSSRSCCLPGQPGSAVHVTIHSVQPSLCNKYSAVSAQCRAALLQAWILNMSTRKVTSDCHCVTSSFTVGLVFAQMSLRCSEVAPGTRPSVEGEGGSDWCVVDAGMLCLVPLLQLEGNWQSCKCRQYICMVLVW